MVSSIPLHKTSPTVTIIICKTSVLLHLLIDYRPCRYTNADTLKGKSDCSQYQTAGVLTEAANEGIIAGLFVTIQ